MTFLYHLLIIKPAFPRKFADLASRVLLFMLYFSVLFGAGRVPWHTQRGQVLRAIFGWDLTGVFGLQDMEDAMRTVAKKIIALLGVSLIQDRLRWRPAALSGGGP